MDSAADVHVCNDLRLMTNFLENPTRVGGSTSDGISPGRGAFNRLTKEDGSERLIPNLRNVFYLPNSPSNLVSLGLLNDAEIYHNNENQSLYDQVSRKPLAFAQRWKTSFLLHPSNLSVSAINLLRTNSNVYKDTTPQTHQTQNNKLSLTTWRQRLGHPNFPALRKHLKRHNIQYNDDELVCDSCERSKATKQYNRVPQQRAERPYQFVHTDFVCPSAPMSVPRI